MPRKTLSPSSTVEIFFNFFRGDFIPNGYDNSWQGQADRIWCGDRGMMSKENIEFMPSGDRRYIIDVSQSTLKRFERELLETEPATDS